MLTSRFHRVRSSRQILVRSYYRWLLSLRMSFACPSRRSKDRKREMLRNITHSSVKKPKTARYSSAERTSINESFTTETAAMEYLDIFELWKRDNEICFIQPISPIPSSPTSDNEQFATMISVQKDIQNQMINFQQEIRQQVLKFMEETQKSIQILKYRWTDTMNDIEKPCVTCRSHGGRHDTRYYCKFCNVALCKDPCFREYHSI